MKWQETIQVRTFCEVSRQKAEAAARELVCSADKEPHHGLDVLKREDVDTDLCLLLHWESCSAKPAKSDLGHRLARMFSEYGWVNHSVWSKPFIGGVK